MKKLTVLLFFLSSCCAGMYAQVSEKKFNNYSWEISHRLQDNSNDTKALKKPIEDIITHGDKYQCVWLAQQLSQLNAFSLTYQNIPTYSAWVRSLLTERLLQMEPDFVALADGRDPSRCLYPYFYPAFSLDWQLAELLALLNEVSDFIGMKEEARKNPEFVPMVEEQWKVRAHYLEYTLYGDDRYATHVLGCNLDSASIKNIVAVLGDDSFVRTPYLIGAALSKVPEFRYYQLMSIEGDFFKYSLFYLSRLDQNVYSLSPVAQTLGLSAEMSQTNLNILNELYPATAEKNKGQLSTIDLNNQEAARAVSEFIQFRQQLLEQGEEFVNYPPMDCPVQISSDSLFEIYSRLYAHVGYLLCQELQSGGGLQSNIRANGNNIRGMLEIMGYADEKEDWLSRLNRYISNLLFLSLDLYYTTHSSWYIGAVTLETNLLTQMMDMAFNENAYYTISQTIPFYLGELYNTEYAKFLMDTYFLPFLPSANLLSKDKESNCYHMQYYAIVLQSLYIYDEPQRSELASFYSERLEKALKRNDCNNDYIIGAMVDYYANVGMDMEKAQHYLNQYLALSGDTAFFNSYNITLYSSPLSEDYERAAYYLNLLNKNDSTTAAGYQYYSGLIPAYVYARVGDNDKARQQLAIFDDFIHQQFAKQLLTLGSAEAGNQLKRYSRIDDCFAETCNEDLSADSRNAFVAEYYNWLLFTKGLLLALSNESKTILQNHPSEPVRKLWQQVSQMETALSTMANRETLQAQLLQNDIDKARAKLLTMVQAYIDEHGTEGVHVTNWQEIRNALQADEVAIEIGVGKHNNEDFTKKEGYVDDEFPTYYALLIRQDSEYPMAIRLFREDSLRSLIEGKNEIQIYSDLDLNARIVHLIIDSLRPYIQEQQTVYFSPNGMLHQLAFENMQWSEDTLLSQKYNLQRLSSTRQLTYRHNDKNISRSDTVVLYGGIVYDANGDDLLSESQRYPDQQVTTSRSMEAENINRGKAGFLKGAQKEVQEIDRLLSTTRQPHELRMGLQANEESFKALNLADVKLLHIATHGFFWENDAATQHQFFRHSMTEEQVLRTIDPMRRCGLLLAGANIALSGHASELPDGVQDGVLTAQEISMLDLNHTKLVILSACETGVGEINSDGVFGLQRAFKKAGVETLIMSLWKVDDAATQLLMTEFYRNWITNKQSKREAFRNAQSAVRTRYDDPVYWAGFIMMD